MKSAAVVLALGQLAVVSAPVVLVQSNLAHLHRLLADPAALV